MVVYACMSWIQGNNTSYQITRNIWTKSIFGFIPQPLFKNGFIPQHYSFSQFHNPSKFFLAWSRALLMTSPLDEVELCIFFSCSLGNAAVVEGRRRGHWRRRLGLNVKDATASQGRRRDHWRRRHGFNVKDAAASQGRRRDHWRRRHGFNVKDAAASQGRRRGHWRRRHGFNVKDTMA